MLNSAACRSKTARAPAGAPRCGKSSRDKGLMQGRSLRCRRAYEISRKVIEDTRQRIPGQTHASLYWPYIATGDAKDASDLQPNRIAYIADLAAQYKESDIREERIRRFVTGHRSYNLHGLYFALNKHASLCIEVEGYIFYFVATMCGGAGHSGRFLQVCVVGKAAIGGACFKTPDRPESETYIAGTARNSGL